MKKGLTLIAVLGLCLFATGCSDSYTTQDYKIRVEELEHELEYTKEELNNALDRLEECGEAYSECYTEAKYCGCHYDIPYYSPYTR